MSPTNGNIGDALPEVQTYGASYEPNGQPEDARIALEKAAMALCLLVAFIERNGLCVPYDELFEVLQ